MDKEVKGLFNIIVYPLLFILLLWSVEIYEVWSNEKFTRYGIYPREWDGVLGILTGPLIHGDWKHLISNSFPLLILSTIILIFYKRVALPSFIGIYFLTGFLVWLFARNSYHIGASGIVYGLISFVFWSGIFRANTRAIILSLVILIAYSGYFQGIKPEEGVSWESHLLGAFSGIFFAFVFKSVLEPEEIEEQKVKVPQTKYHFLPRDIFEKTKYQRWLDLQREEE